MNKVQWLTAYAVLLIWDPDKMSFILDPARRSRQRLYYKTRGIVEHDRALNGQLKVKTI